jgi:hypothetical protein
MNNWCICWVFMHILLGILIFKGLTARRLYKSFGVKGLIQNVEAETIHRNKKSSPLNVHDHILQPVNYVEIQAKCKANRFFLFTTFISTLFFSIHSSYLSISISLNFELLVTPFTTSLDRTKNSPDFEVGVSCWWAAVMFWRRITRRK